MSYHPEALVDPELRILENIMYWAQGEIAGSETSQKLQLVELLESWPAVPVLIEQFTLRKFSKSRDLLSPVRISAHVEWLCEAGVCIIIDGDEFDLDPRPYDWQNPDAAMDTATDARLKDWGLYIREGGEEHARDATRHNITYIRAAKEEAPNRARRLRHMWPALYGPGGDLEHMTGRRS